MNQFTGQGIREQRGIVLIVSLLVLTVLSVLGLAFLATARTEDTIAANYRNHTAAFYAAEAGVESGVSSLKALLATTPVPTDLQLAGTLAPALTDPNYTFDAFQVTRVRTAQPYSYTSSIASGTFSGLVAQRTDYVVTAQVTGPRGSRARLSQTIQYMQIPLFQFAVFYGRGVDLEITPSPPMIIKGRVHANSNLHTLARTSLQYDERVTTSGHVYHYIKRDPTDRGTDPTIKAADGTYKPLNFDFEYGPGLTPWTPAEWKDHALQTFGGTLQDKEMGVKDLNLPLPDLLTSGTPDVVSHQIIEKGSVGDSQALKDAKLYYQADLRIVDDKAYDKAGNPVNINGCKDASNKQAVRKESFWDNREKLTMQVTQIDVGALTACGVMPTNGILYTSAKAGSP
ncbi:MAG: PilX N-terminal domain-containing pilus assembly protein, partial [Candidatus Methylomirabilales bacterium]